MAGGRVETFCKSEKEEKLQGKPLLLYSTIAFGAKNSQDFFFVFILEVTNPFFY